MKSIKPIVLASGFSKRYNSEISKLADMVDGKHMFMHICEIISQLHYERLVEKPIIVTRKEQNFIVGSQIISDNFDVVFNDAAIEGISSSIKQGLKFASSFDFYMFCVADQPYLKYETLKNFILKFYEIIEISVNLDIAAIGFEDRLGNPVIFSKKYREELLSLTGDSGGKSVLKKNIEHMLVYPVDERELIDIDYII